jgi:hypothetical protein
MSTYLKNSIATMLRIYALYQPLRTFVYVGAVIFFIGIIGVFRFLFFWLTVTGEGHIQSLVMSGALLVMGFQVWMLGIVADLISVNRRLSEEVLYRVKKREMSPNNNVEATSGDVEGVSITLGESRERNVASVSRFSGP